MKKNKLLVALFVALAIAVAAYFYLKHKAKKKEDKGILPPAAPPKDAVHVAPGTHEASTPAVPMDAGIFPLKHGSRGKAVQMIQVIVGIKPDGVWGVATDLAVKRSLKDSDGIIYPKEFLDYTTGLGKSSPKEWPLALGSTGNYVKALQIMLSQKVDGKFGAKTAGALRTATGKSSVTADEFVNLIKSTILST